MWETWVQSLDWEDPLEKGRATCCLGYSTAFTISSKVHRDSLVAQLVKNLPALQETPFQFLGQEDPLEKG